MNDIEDFQFSQTHAKPSATPPSTKLNTRLQCMGCKLVGWTLSVYHAIIILHEATSPWRVGMDAPCIINTPIGQAYNQFIVQQDLEISDISCTRTVISHSLQTLVLNKHSDRWNYYKHSRTPLTVCPRINNNLLHILYYCRRALLLP